MSFTSRPRLFNGVPYPREFSTQIPLSPNVGFPVWKPSIKPKLKPNYQTGRTCYAHAVAFALHNAMKRVVGRSGGYPKFEDILKQIIDDFGTEGAHIDPVLKKYTAIYRLRYKLLAGEEQARAAIAHGREIVASFSFSTKDENQANSRGQWDDFDDFFKRNPRGVLKSRDLGDHKTDKKSAHAVFLFDCEPSGLVFMNSWGEDWADGGYFRVANADVLGVKFFDVFAVQEDLKLEEIKAIIDQRREMGRQICKRWAPFTSKLLWEPGPKSRSNRGMPSSH
ncbi:uncharacterized protein LOC110860372 [Folsomia candida]|uniref:Cyanate hydratase n=1 Tax=Folsomia candida TaxID=158441 RepID=A0A226D621_FOLCA|nr:uncharacterized protein LOC110860372 [Folsomia candida]XP_035716072.1 uncharacterized protein LOC110860372 [Folsomia candida]XP_035716073.1 uncharacterized protein LOC110860372 [Folsomia candida]XP_035716074.1 uncharacterized protein LOC110860372 [Folsomia candida]XP_035716075.1 uncharacterized protein LOC110860372 [Folsomia candida]OXA40995.1 Cyanate hydratase [Folsomia candida]